MAQHFSWIFHEQMCLFGDFGSFLWSVSRFDSMGLRNPCGQIEGKSMFRWICFNMDDCVTWHGCTFKVGKEEPFFACLSINVSRGWCKNTFVAIKKQYHRFFHPSSGSPRQRGEKAIKSKLKLRRSSYLLWRCHLRSFAGNGWAKCLGSLSNIIITVDAWSDCFSIER